MIKQTAGRDSLGEFAPNFAHYNDDILFGENWNDNPAKGKGNAVNRQCVKTADNYIGGTVAEADQF